VRINNALNIIAGRLLSYCDNDDNDERDESTSKDQKAGNPSKKHQQAQTFSRRVGGSKGPSIQMKGVLHHGSLLICRQAAINILGVGPARVMRVWVL
jgi:hypothetical protein